MSQSSHAPENSLTYTWHQLGQIEIGISCFIFSEIIAQQLHSVVLLECCNDASIQGLDRRGGVCWRVHHFDIAEAKKIHALDLLKRYECNLVAGCIVHEHKNTLALIGHASVDRSDPFLQRPEVQHETERIPLQLHAQDNARLHLHASNFLCWQSSKHGQLAATPCQSRGGA